MDSYTPEELAQIWSGIVADTAPVQRGWLATSKLLMIAEHTAVIAVPNELTRSRLESRLRTRLEDTLSDAINSKVRIAISVDEKLPSQPTDDVAAAEDVAVAAAPPQEAGVGRARVDAQLPLPVSPRALNGDSQLNPRYTFDTFVIGASNRFAHAAAVAAAESPGKAYNPLLVYGDSGLGKTHLLHAIGHYVGSLFVDTKVRYVSSEEFTNEFINAIRDDKAAAFQKKYRDVDVLLIENKSPSPEHTHTHAPISSN